MITVVRRQDTEPSGRAEGTFTGEAWRDTILPRQDGVAMADVFFAPGSRTFWHAHEGGQILIVRAGEGLVGDDHGVVRVTVGDTIWTPPGVRHWHGATPDRYLVHTGISLAGVDWFDAVPDEVYTSAAPAGGAAAEGMGVW
jgi:quercetin dioxygenase-like cupin family protein